MTTPAAAPLVVLQEVDTPAGLPRVLRAQGLRALLDADDTLSGGVGGWEQVPRPRRRPGTEWSGQPLFELVLPLLLDGTASTAARDRSVETEVAELIALGTLPERRSQPPSITVTGPVRQPRHGMRWLVQDLQWGEQIRNSAGQRVMQQVTVTLLEGVGVQALLGPAARAQTRSTPRPAAAATTTARRAPLRR